MHESPRPSRCNHNIWRSTGSQEHRKRLHPRPAQCALSHDRMRRHQKSNEGTKTVPLDPATPKQTVLISEDLLPNEEARLLSFLNRNKDVFAWSTLDLVGVSCTIIEHSLGIDSFVRPRKQRLQKMSDEKIEAAKAEVHRPLEAKFIKPIVYPNHQGPYRWRPCSRPRSIKRFQAQTKAWCDNTVSPKEFDEGDLILIRTTRTESQGKLKPKWEGPFIVKKKTSPNAYRLKSQSNEDLEHSWNIDNLRIFFV
jgi:hypothetical protein